ncbi:hypothetical protein DL768_007155 [Monosporascus sp. mg162]|nr:hypothetical protein DL768_007155 [Monosporascus sp. mg162]
MTLRRRDEKRSFSERLHVLKSSLDPKSDKYGLKTFYESVNAVADIVFVHGITGHREHTWATGERGARPWPESLLPAKVPYSRILSFGYDAAVIGWRTRISSNRIGDHAKNLVAALASHRDADNSSNRPIIFVCHSLGGLVCKDALWCSKTSPENHLQRILNCTLGILFLGTPHSGTGLAKVAERLIQLVSNPATRTNLRILEVLCRDSEVLARIQDDFHSLLRCRDNEGFPPIEITCFYEELPLPGIGEVVPKHSAILPGYPAIGIHSDHRDIARFATEDEPGFISILGELQRWMKEIQLGQYRAGSPRSSRSKSLEGKNMFNANAHMRSHNSNNYGGITIHGDVVESNVVNGGMTIHGGLRFGN